jgi:spore coat polysaccharide biosynthesis protein SpsF
MRTVAIIQARMGSTRLPGKVLMDITGETMLARVINRVRRATRIHETVVATTVSQKDGPIVAECKKLNVAYFQGSEEDVLDRYYQAALVYKAKAVVRITSDCPFIDPEVIDTVIEAFLNRKPDYASNCLERSYPRGLATEVMSLRALEHAWRKAQKPYQRVHVTPYIYENPKVFRTISVKADADYSQHRWTVDTTEDLNLARAIYVRVIGRQFGWQTVLDLVSREPWLLELNRDVRQKDLEEC